MKRVLINLVQPNSGGGQQNALSFLSELSRTSYPVDSLVVCVEGTNIHNKCNELGIRHVVIPKGMLGRIYYEFVQCRVIIGDFNPCVIFTLFGNPPLMAPNSIRTVSGFALSNLLNPDVEFWNYLPLHKRFVKKIKDKARAWLSSRSDELIFETKLLCDKAKATRFKGNVCHLVEMEMSKSAVTFPKLPFEATKHIDEIKFLFLSGPHPNKRIHLMAGILNFLKRELNDLDFKVSVSFDESSRYATEIKSHFARFGVSEYLQFIGSVDPDQVLSVIREHDFLVCISRLESFSNNWVEAWAACVPLVVTDSEWSKASCGEAAIYIDPENPVQAASTLARAIESTKLMNSVVIEGGKRLEAMSDSGTKFEKYMAILEGPVSR